MSENPPPLVDRLGLQGFAIEMTRRFRAALADEPAAGRVRALTHLANAAFRENLDRAPRPQPVACAKGCAWCCATRVAATPPEVLALARHLRERIEPAPRAALAARVVDAGTALTGLDDAARAASRRFCALLGADSACSVYAARPLACRGVMAFDASACKANHEGSLPEVTYYGAPLQIRMAIQLPLMAALRRGRLAWRLADLPVALAAALARDDAEAAWLAGEDVFAAAALPDTRFDPRQLDSVDALVDRA